MKDGSTWEQKGMEEVAGGESGTDVLGEVARLDERSVAVGAGEGFDAVVSALRTSKRAGERRHSQNKRRANERGRRVSEKPTLWIVSEATSVKAFSQPGWSQTKGSGRVKIDEAGQLEDHGAMRRRKEKRALTLVRVSSLVLSERRCLREGLAARRADEGLVTGVGLDVSEGTPRARQEQVSEASR